MSIFSNFTWQKIYTTGFVSNIKKSFLYFGASIIGLFVSIFTTPIFARNMSPFDFAITGYFTSINGFLFPFYTMHFYSYYIMIYFKQNENENKNVLGSIVIFLFFWNLLFSVLAYLILFGYFKLFTITFSLWPFAVIVIGTSFFRIYSTLLQINYRLRKEAFKFFLLTSALKILNILFSIILVAYFKMGAEGKLLGILLGEIGISIFTFKELKKYLKFHFDFAIINDAFKYSLPLLLGGFTHLLITNYDKIVLERLNNVNEFALYNIGATVSGYLLLMGTSIFQAFEPDIYKFVNQKQERKLGKYIFLITVLIIFIIIIFILSSKYIMAFLTDNKYTLAYTYANILAISILFTIIYSFVSSILLALQKTKETLVITAIVGLLGILIYNTFIDKWGFYGAAYAKIFLFFLLIILTFIFIKFKIKINFKKRVIKKFE